MFSGRVDVPSLTQFSHGVCVRSLFLWCVRKSSFWSPLQSSFFSDLNNSGEQPVFCYLNVGSEFGARQWSAHQRLDVRAPLLALRSPSFSLLLPQPQHFQYGGMGRLNISFHDRDSAEESSILQRGCWRGKRQRRVWNSGGRSLHRHRCPSRTLPPARVGVRLQPSPVPAATNQLHYPDSSRLVRRKDSSSMRSGSPPSCRDDGGGCA